MDKEENNMSLKRKSKSVGVSVDSDDDEPIGALLKLKGKRNNKKTKVTADAGGKKPYGVEKMVIGDEEFGGMDETLAIFRKKLRGPKKDVGSVLADARELKLSPSLTPDTQKRTLLSSDGGSHGEGLKVKKRNKGAKICLDTVVAKKCENDDNVDALHRWKEEGAVEFEGDGLEGPLSALFQKVQPGKSLKSRGSSKLRKARDAKACEDGLRAKPCGGQEAPAENSQPRPRLPDNNFLTSPSQGSIKTPGNSTDHKQDMSSSSLEPILMLKSPNGLDHSCMKVISHDSASSSLADSSPSSLKACFEDGKINLSTAEAQQDPTIEPLGLKDMKAKDMILSTTLCEGMEIINDDVKQNSSVSLGKKCLGQEQDHTSPFALSRPQEELQSGDDDGPIVVVGNCFKGTNPAALYSQVVDDVSESRSSPVSADENLNYAVAFRKHDVKSPKGVDESEHDVESSHLLPEAGACQTNNHDDPSEDEAINGISYTSVAQDHQGSSGEDRGSPVDLETKESNQSAVQRAVRNVRRYRHDDMAYDDDIDWDVLMQSHEFFASVERTREKLNLGKAAAVAAGLKTRPGPLEKIKFKEVLKRKGGQSEYLECRNYILRVWNKDVTRILRLEHFSVSDNPLVGESLRTTLIRDIFTFLDQYGYINFGVPSEKMVDNCIQNDIKLQPEDKLRENSVLPAVDLEDASVLEKEKNPEAYSGEKSDNRELAEKVMAEDGLPNHDTSGPSSLSLPKAYSPGDCEGINSFEHLTLGKADSGKGQDDGTVPSASLTPGAEVCDGPAKLPEDSSDILSASNDCSDNDRLRDTGSRKNVIVVGAGPAGLTAARHLQRQGFDVTVLEARSRVGGRVFTDRSSLSVPVDLGASIITGVEADLDSQRRPDPSSLICAQLGLELPVLNSECPLYDVVTGQKVQADLDNSVEAEFNSMINDVDLFADEKGEQAMQMSLEEGLEYQYLQRRHSNNPAEDNMETKIAVEGHEADVQNPLERRIMDWHYAHLEYGCAAPLKEVSLLNWNQDDAYGGFGGAHCMIKGGFSAVVESMAKGVSIHLDHVVTDISYYTQGHIRNGNLHKRVKVCTSNGKEFLGDAVLVTVPLGCLKAEAIKFSPPLPEWKYLSIKKLGFGVLNKIALEFPEVFWDDNIDYFGATAEDRDQRGRCFMFWNVKKTVGAPVLIALLVGKAALDGEDMNSTDHVNHALLVLRKLFGEDKVCNPVGSVVTNWGRDPFSYGAYSYVAMGSSGEDYDLLGRPVENCLFFAGEATCKEHPDTVGGAMISGLREAVRIIDILNTGADYTAEVEATEAARRHSDIGRSEVKDIISRLESVQLSSSSLKKYLDGTQISTWGSMLKEMFFSAKTRAGRLRLAKELLSLPVGFLKSFASTKEGLSTLNSWILDSMGKNGTQLLRHCVRLLVLVSNDLLAVRLSGIGKTVKEKVCVHTSRDIRAIASQLVSVWVELFRKEKRASKGLKLLRHQSSLDSKSKYPLVSGKPPLRTLHNDGKGNSKGSTSGGHQICSTAITKRTVDESVTPKAKIHAKSDAPFSNSQGSAGCSKDQEDNHEIPMSEEEKAAFAAAEAARVAALAAAEAYASGALQNASRQAPKILSFHKFALREQNPRVDESDSRKIWTGAEIGKPDCLSEIDSRNCRVRDWSVDFSATGVPLENSKMSADNRSQRSHSNEIANHLNMREHSGENVAVDSSILTRAWVDNAGSIGIKDYNAIERWQCQAAAASSGFSHGTMHITDEEESNMSSKFSKQKQDLPANESSASQVSINRELKGKQHRGAERIKQSVVDYVATLLMPLYKARKIDRDGYKYIMKKTATKVMEQATDFEKSMTVHDFLDFKRKNKIRAFVDTLIERHMSTKPDYEKD